MLAVIEFVTPAFLAGAAAAAVPIVIHLIHRRRTRVIEFSTLRFLRRVDRRIARRRRLEDVLVLVLRAGLLVLAALALAGPVLRLLPGRLPVARVVLVDNSYSMDLVSGGATGLQRALAAARGLIDDLRNGDLAAVVPLHPAPAAVRLLRDLERSREGLASIAPSPGDTPLADAVRPALKALLAAPAPVRELIVLTDLQAGGMKPLLEEGLLEGLAGKVRLAFVAPPARPVRNLTVAAAEAVPLPGGVRRVVVTVRNAGDLPVRTRLTLEVKGRATQARPITVEPGGVLDCQLEVRGLGPDPCSAAVHLGADDLPADNHRYLVLPGRRAVPVLVARTSASHVARLDPAYYLLRALRPRSEGTIEPTVCRVADLARFDLAAYGAVVLADPAALPEQVASALLDYIRDGGSLLLSCGPALEPDALNHIDGGSFPVVLGAQVEAADDAGFLSLAGLDRRHPVVRTLLATTPPVDLTAPRFYRHLSVSARAGAPNEVLARFSSGRPALLQARLGRGRVMVFASTLTPEWTDLPYRVSFVPLMHALVHGLVRASRRQEDWEVLHPVVIEYPPAVEAPRTVRIRGPGGFEAVRTPVPAGEGYAVRLGPLPRPGGYRLSETTAGGDRTTPLVANVDPAEGDLRRTPEHRVPGARIPLADPRAAAAALRPGDEGVGLDGLLLVVAAALLALEGFLTARIAFGGGLR